MQKRGGRTLQPGGELSIVRRGLALSDTVLRELERRFRASGNVEDEAAWLRARVQAGELEPRKLELAAYCGCAGALRAMPDARLGRPLDVAKAVDLGEQWGSEVALRARAGVVARAVVAWESALSGDRSLREVSLAAHACSLNPGDETWSRLADTCQEVGDRLPELVDPGEISHLLQCGLLLQEGYAPRLADLHEVAWLAGLLFADESHADYPEFRTLPLSESGLGLILGAMEVEVAHWALSYSDPVRQRVEARRQETAGE
ncbi:MAG: hypothetical protein R3F62_22965 [Planctomycetota bacterium]